MQINETFGFYGAAAGCGKPPYPGSWRTALEKDSVCLPPGFDPDARVGAARQFVWDVRRASKAFAMSSGLQDAVRAACVGLFGHVDDGLGGLLAL